MKTVSEITKALFELAPANMQEEWDNVGLLCGHREQEVRRVLVALDPFPPVIQEARDWGAELLVTHHPLIFRPQKSVQDGDTVGSSLLTLIESGIAAVNLHTNLDSAPGGVNDCLAKALGLADVQVLAPAGEDGQGRAYGLGRVGTVAPCALPDFLERVKSALRCGGLRFVDGGREVRRVAVGGGACGDLFPEAIALGCDTFVTADVKYNQFADAAALGLSLIDAGHFPTENVVCPQLQSFLVARFPDLEVRLSEIHEDVVKFA